MTHENIDYIEILRRQGFRVTSQRLTVLDAVCDIGGHATLEQIQQRVKEIDPQIDPSTIYRALHVLCRAGLIVSAELDGKVYEIAGETPHHHLVCTLCGGVQALDHIFVQQFYDQLQQKFGFVVSTDHLTLAGVCNQCH